MDSVHSAEGRNAVVKKVDSGVEIAKLKEEHSREVEKLKFESKIKYLESENESRMKIVQLEKDNQTLTHKLELLKLKNEYDLGSRKIVADCELEKEMLKMKMDFQNKLAEKDKEITAQQGEFKIKLGEKDQEIATKENDFKTKLSGIENVNKIKLLELEKQMLANENELHLRIKDLESINKAGIGEIASPDVIAAQKVQDQEKHFDGMITETQKLVWGADKFFTDKSVERNLFESYQEWYKEISVLLHGEVCISSGKSNYVFIIKRDCVPFYASLWLIYHRKGHEGLNDRDDIFYVEDDEKRLWKKAKFMLLHPLDHNKSLKMVEGGEGKDFEQWVVRNVTRDFYQGEKKTAIMFGIF